MWKTNLMTSAAVLVATVAVTGGLLLAAAPPTAKPADSARWAQTEEKLAKFRKITQPQPGEHVTNMARIAWERDPWAAAVRAAKEGKPVIAYGPGMVGLPCGYG